MLIGNPVDFDRIRARYEALRYPTPEEASFNATRASYEGLLTGSGFDTQMVPTTTPGEQVSFSVDPNTGQVTTQIPQYDIPNFQTIYDVGEGLIGADGLPASRGVAQAPINQQLQRSGLSQNRGGGENRNRSPFTDNRSIGQIEQDLENATVRNALLGLVNPAFGILGTLGTLDDKRRVQEYRQRQFENAKSIEDNQRASDAVSGFSEDTVAPGADASTIGGTGGRRGGAGQNTGGPTGPGGTTSGPPGREGPGR
jgi:hypothetical protein